MKRFITLFKNKKGKQHTFKKFEKRRIIKKGKLIVILNIKS